MVGAAEAVLSGGAEQLAVSAPAALGIAVLAIAAVVGAGLAATGAAVTFLGWRYDRRHPPRGELGDDVVEMLRQRPAQPGARLFTADGMTEALRRITEEDGRG